MTDAMPPPPWADLPAPAPSVEPDIVDVSSFNTGDGSACYHRQKRCCLSALCSAAASELLPFTATGMLLQ